MTSPVCSVSFCICLCHCWDGCDLLGQSTHIGAWILPQKGLIEGLCNKPKGGIMALQMLRLGYTDPGWYTADLVQVHCTVC